MIFDSPRDSKAQRIMMETNLTAFTALQKTQNVKAPIHLN